MPMFVVVREKGGMQPFPSQLIPIQKRTLQLNQTHSKELFLILI